MKAPKAYSYLRFSTPEQSKGDSFRRQTEASRAYAKRHGLDLDESDTFKDLGVSAFRGKNSQGGALGAFLKAVETGQVRKGSYLLVENLDRLSRDKVPIAFNQFTGILGRGVNIVTLTDNKLYTSATINESFGDLMLSLTSMYRAHEESALKSKRLGAAWKVKKEEAAQPGGEKITSRGPAWLSLNRTENKWVVIGKRQNVVRRIFDMTIAGHGKSTIARRFNAEGVPTFGDSEGWHPSYVQKILENEAVCGVYQPMKSQMKDGRKKRVADGEPISGYYPIVVDRATFERARLSRAARRIPAGRKGKHFSNLFTGLMFCGSCGAAMHYVNKGEGSKGGSYLACSNARRAISNCKAPSWKYGPVEALLVLCMEELNYDELFPEITDSTREALQRLENAKLETEADLAQSKMRLSNLADAIEQDSKQPTLIARLNAQQEKFDGLTAAISALDEEIENERERAKNAEHDFRQVQGGLQRLDKAHQLRGAELYDLRSRLHQLLKRTIQDINLRPGNRTAVESRPFGNLFGEIAVRFRSAKTERALYVEKGLRTCFSVSVRNGKPDMTRGKMLTPPS